MAMDPMDREPNVYNRETNVYGAEKRGSNTLGWVIGGLVIALGLLAFLFYDGDRDEVSTTGTVTPPAATAPADPATPRSTPATPAPAAPSSPAAPTAPANPQ